LKVYEKQTQPLIEYYKKKIPVIEVETPQIETPPETIIEKMINKLKKAT